MTKKIIMTDFQIKIIKDLKEAFGEPINKFRGVLKKIVPVVPLACFEENSFEENSTIGLFRG